MAFEMLKSTTPLFRLLPSTVMYDFLALKPFADPNGIEGCQQSAGTSSPGHLPGLRLVLSCIGSQRIHACAAALILLSVTPGTEGDRRKPAGIYICDIRGFIMIALGGMSELLQLELRCSVQKTHQKGMHHGGARDPRPGPVTQAGCGALCPRYHRWCDGGHGPWTEKTVLHSRTNSGFWGQTDDQNVRGFRGFNAWSWQFRKASEECDHK